MATSTKKKMLVVFFIVKKKSTHDSFYIHTQVFLRQIIERTISDILFSFIVLFVVVVVVRIKNGPCPSIFLMLLKPKVLIKVVLFAFQVVACV